MLITKELEKMIPKMYSSEDTKLEDKIVYAKFFTPDSNWTWYIIEYSQEDEDTCYGYVQGLEDELGYFSLSEISLIRGYLGLPVERDLFFQPTLLSKIREEAKQCIS